MGGWFSKIFGRNDAGKPSASAAVRQALQKALRNRTSIVLEAPQGLVASAFVQTVSGDEMIVTQPSVGGIIYPLAEGEWLKLSFVERDTNLSGRTMCVGRLKSKGPRGMTHVYRLSIPEVLRFEDRRGQPRNAIDPDVAPSVQTTGGRLKSPLMCELADISVSGLRMHTSEPTDGIEVNHELTVQFLLPEPAGMIEEVVEVQRLLVDDATRKNAICASFRRRIPRLEALLQMTTDRLPMPLEQEMRRVA